MKTWNDVQIGDTYGPLTYTISDATSKRFIAVTKASHPWYESESPYGSQLVPSTLASNDDFPLIGTDLDTGVHAKHRLRLFHPMLVGEEVTTSGVVVDKYKKRGNRYLVFQYQATNAAGVVLSENTITFALPGEE